MNRLKNNQTNPGISTLQKIDAFFAFALMLFAFLFVYLIIRAVFNEPIQDELATFTNYIQSGLPHNNNIHLDANNHLLNTYFSSIVYYFSGNSSFFWMRLPNLLSFPLYFFSIYFLLKRLKTQALKFTGLIVLTCIPFILEYFAYCRGYGLSFAFLTVSLLQLVRFLDGTSKRAYAIGILSILLATAANLSLMPLCLFIFGYFLLTTLFRKRMNFRLMLRTRILPTIVFLGGFTFLIIYSFQLKKAGALYWGGTDGLWASTGFSLANYLLFNTELLWKYVIIILLVVFGMHLIRLFIVERTASLRRTDLAFIALLFGLLVFLECGFRFLGLMYPLDRGGLYLVLLLFLSLVFVLDYWKAGKLLHWTLLYFIWPFATHLSIHSSVYSPGDRMTDAFYARILPYLAPNTSILCNNHLTRSFYYQEWRHGQFHYAACEMFTPKYADIWISRTDTNSDVPDGYVLIAKDEAHCTAVYKRKSPAKCVRVAVKGSQKIVYQEKLTNNYILVPRSAIAPGADQTLAIELSGHFKSPASANTITLAISAFDTNENGVYYSAAFLGHWFQGRAINKDFHTKITLEGLQGAPVSFAVYFLTPTGEKLVVSDLDYSISIVK